MTRKRLFTIAEKLRATRYRSLEEIADKIETIAENGDMGVCEELLEGLQNV